MVHFSKVQLDDFNTNSDPDHKLDHGRFSFAIRSWPHTSCPKKLVETRCTWKRQAVNKCNRGQQKEASAQLQLLLPFASKRGGKLVKYRWNGQRIELAIEDATRGHANPLCKYDCAKFVNVYKNARRWYASFLLLMGSSRGESGAVIVVRAGVVYPTKNSRIVKALQRIALNISLTKRLFSATMQNFATQSLLTAIGIGARQSMAASALINWMLKDGINKIVRMTVATSFGQLFDSDLKRLRFASSLVFTTCIGGEFLTPLFPQHFLLLACISNVGKAAGITTYLSTVPAFHLSLSVNGNIANMSAKTQAQNMLMDTCSLGICSLLVYLVRNHPRARSMLPLLAFPICALGDLTGVYNELKSVQLRTLNKQRAELLAEHWIQQRHALSTAEMSAAEPLIWKPSFKYGFFPLNLLPLEKMEVSLEELLQLVEKYNKQMYVLSVFQNHPRDWWTAARGDRSGINISLSAEAHSEHILEGVLEAAYIRRFLRDLCGTEKARYNGLVQSASILATGDTSSQVPKLLSNGVSASHLWDTTMRDILDNSRLFAKDEICHFISDLRAAGWQLDPFLLSTSEANGYMKTD